MNKLKYFLLISFFFICFSNFVFADEATIKGEDATIKGEDATIKGKLESVSIPDPLGLDTDKKITTEQKAASLFGMIIKAMLGLVGSLAFIVFIVGGVVWLTSSGNQEQIKKGKDMFIYATIGLVVVFSSYAILNFVINVLTSK